MDLGPGEIPDDKTGSIDQARMGSAEGDCPLKEDTHLLSNLTRCHCLTEFTR